jgi:hypothetical protein
VDPNRPGSRRSFLSLVAGGLLAGAAGSFVAVPGAESRPRRKARQMTVDNDPADPAREPGAPRPPRRPSRITANPHPPPPVPGPDGGRGPMSRFVICPGNRRCPGRNP